MMTSREFRADALLRVALFGASLAGTVLPASSASPAPAQARIPAVKAPDPSPQRPAEPDPASRSAVARTRMLECGHQWNSLKRAGTASGTWKDFSRGCLAAQR